MYILDTDTLTHLHAGHAGVAKHLRELADPDVAITIITKIELLRGRSEFLLKGDSAVDILRAQGLLARTEDLLAQLRILPFDQAAGAYFERFRARGALGKMGRADLLIACISLSQRATLVTRNVRHFRQVPELRIENWVD